jgi:hypothetical protein
LCPYFTYWRGLGYIALFFFIYWLKTIDFIEDLANYPYPPFFFSTLLSLCSGKRKALRKTHHPRLVKKQQWRGWYNASWAWSAAGQVQILVSITYFVGD